MPLTDPPASPRRPASVPCGPGAALLTSAGRHGAGDPPGRVDIFHLRIPPHGRTPEHDHGFSRAVLVPLSGVVRCHQSARVRTLPVGRTARVGAGERLRLVNPGARPASLLVVIGSSASADEWDADEWDAIEAGAR